jgi:hypothetical protein
MDTNVLWTVIVGAVAAIAGYVFGMVDSRVTNAIKENRAEQAALKEATARESIPARLDEHSVLKVTVDPTLRWHLELDGTQLEPEGLTPEQRARLVNVIVQIRPWIDGKTTAAPAPAAPASALVSATIQTGMVQTSAPAAPVPAVAPPAGPPRLDIARGFRSLLEKELKGAEPEKGPSIVRMIDDVLQKKLELSPLAAKHIRLEEGSVGEVVVYVGVQRYSGVDAVPDEAIKGIIKEAIAEWNRG